MGTWYVLTCARLPGNGARNPSSYLLSMRWFSLEEERVMQQSSVSISLRFENQGINPVGDDAQVIEYLHKQSRTCNQRDKGVVNPFMATRKSVI